MSPLPPPEQFQFQLGVFGALFAENGEAAWLGLGLPMLPIPTPEKKRTSWPFFGGPQNSWTQSGSGAFVQELPCVTVWPWFLFRRPFLFLFEQNSITLGLRQELDLRPSAPLWPSWCFVHGPGGTFQLVNHEAGSQDSMGQR